MPTIHLIDTIPKFDKLLNRLQDKTILAVDLEFTNLDVYASTLLLMSLAYTEEYAYVVDFTKIPIEYLKQLAFILEDPNVLKLAHNATTEYKHILHNSKIKMQNIHDCMIADQIIFAGLSYRYGLKEVAERRLGIELDKSIRKEFTEWQEGNTFTLEQIQYSGEDATNLLKIYPLQIKDIQARELNKIYDLEMSIIPITATMEHVGCYMNKQMLLDMREPFEHFVQVADKAFQDIVLEFNAADEIVFDRDGYSVVNTGSPKQVVEVLHKIGIHVEGLNSKIVQRYDMLQSRKKGKKSLEFEVDYHLLMDDEDVANALDLYTVLNNKVLRAYTFLVGAKKLLNAFILSLAESINPVTNRVHPNFRTCGATRTGRFSSNSPNFQQIPNDRKLAALGLGEYSIRKCIEAPKSRKLIIADYSGIELVILAVLSGDEKLMEEIIKGDVHTYVTQQVLNVQDINNKNKKKEPYATWRQGSKRISYSIAYGTTSRNLSESLNIDLASVGFKITQKEGDEIIDKWFKLFPKTAAYLNANARQGVLKGYVTDPFGRRRNWDLKELHAPTTDAKWKRLACEREAKNFPIQGGSASMTKTALKLLWDRLDYHRARVVIVVHDEIVLEAVSSYVEEAKRILKECMEEALALTLPAVTDLVGKYESLSVSPAESDRYDK
jgi:DNA polymerase I-like protein with 3'-5' exonuclease and polymerase domains